MGKQNMLFKSLLGGIKAIKSPSKKKHSETFHPKKEERDQERDAPKHKRRWSLGGKSSRKRPKEVFLPFGDEEVRKMNILVGPWRDSKVGGAEEHCDGAVADTVLADSKSTDEKHQREQAVIKMQTAFRGYLARRALRALKSLVRLQALARGRFVRKQAAAKLQCMQALLNVEACIHTLQIRLCEEAQALQHQLQNKRFINGWDNSRSSLQELQAKAQTRQQAIIRRQRALAYAFSKQLRNSAFSKQGSITIGCESDKNQLGWSWLERWMAAKHWESSFPEGSLFPKRDEDQQQPDILSSIKRLEILKTTQGKPKVIDNNRKPFLNELLAKDASSKKLSKNNTRSPFPCPNSSISSQPTILMASEVNQLTSNSDLHCMSTASVRPLLQPSSTSPCSMPSQPTRLMAYEVNQLTSNSNLHCMSTASVSSLSQPSSTRYCSLSSQPTELMASEVNQLTSNSNLHCMSSASVSSLSQPSSTRYCSLSSQPTELMASEVNQLTSNSKLHCMSTASVSPLSQPSSTTPCSMSSQPTGLMASEVNRLTSNSSLHCMSTASVSPLSQPSSTRACSIGQHINSRVVSGESRSYGSITAETTLVSDSQDMKDDANSGPKQGFTQTSAAEQSMATMLRNLKLSMENRARMRALHKVEEVENVASPSPSYMVPTQSAKAKAQHSPSNQRQQRQDGVSSSSKRRHSPSGLEANGHAAPPRFLSASKRSLFSIKDNIDSR